jgi:AcrR family transcriptional regulator
MDYKTLVSKPKTKRGRETLNRILSAAAQVFYEKGYHNASINDITRLAGVASGTFYVYFDGKYSLYKFLLLQCSHMIRKHLNQATLNCKNRREVEEVGLRVWLDFVRKNRYMYHIIWESLYIDKQLFQDYYVSFAKAYIDGIDQAKGRGEIKADIDSEVLAYTLMGASNFLGLNWGLFKPEADGLDKVVSDFMKILGDNIFTAACPPAPPAEEPPIRIQVEFDDEEDEEDSWIAHVGDRAEPNKPQP